MKIFQDLDALVGKTVTITVSSRRTCDLSMRGILQRRGNGYYYADHAQYGETPTFCVLFSREDVNVVEPFGTQHKINISL